MAKHSAESREDDLRSELFTATDWGIVQSAGQAGSPAGRKALEELCRTYWYPLFAYIRRRGHDPQEAQDLTQEFMMRLLEKNYVAHADRHKGRFRSFLLAALNHFLANEQRRAHAAKRGAGDSTISLDGETAEARYALESAVDLTPEKIYERRWALTLLEQALARLRQECVTAGKAEQFDQLKMFLNCEEQEISHEAVAAQMGTTPGAVAVAVHRLRQRYRQSVCEEIRRTVNNPADMEDELRWLFSAIS